MLQLPDHIRITFYQAMIGEMDLNRFEQWVYKSSELEQQLSEQLYLDLISFNYKKSGAKYELFHLLELHVDKGEYETYKLRRLLCKAKEQSLELPGILEQFYELYCYGYDFLGELAIDYGLTVSSLPMPYQADHWSALSNEELSKLVESLWPELESEVIKVERWLDEGKIILTGEQDELEHYKYIDNRLEEEKQV